MDDLIAEAVVDEWLFVRARVMASSAAELLATATLSAEEARARAWRTCSFAHLSATTMATVMENTDEFGLDSSTLLKASIAARFCAEGTSGGEAKAREYMQEAGLTFNERNTPPPWVPRATKVAGPDRARRPLPYLEIGY